MSYKLQCDSTNTHGNSIVQSPTRAQQPSQQSAPCYNNHDNITARDSAITSILAENNEPPLTSRQARTRAPPRSYKYVFAANELLANVQQPSHQPTPNMLLSTFNVNRHNIREWAILDSGASSHFLCLDAPVTNKQIANDPITVIQPDGYTMTSTHDSDLDLPQLPRAARRCHILPAIKQSLISVVKLCEAGCEVKFIKWGVGIEIRYRGRIVLEGALNKRTGLWMVPLTKQERPPVIKQEASSVLTTRPSSPTSVTNFNEATSNESTSSTHVLANSSHQQVDPTQDSPPRLRQIDLRGSSSQKYPSFEHFAGNVRQTTSMAELAMYHHQSLGSPPRTTLLRAIRKHPNLFHTFPGLNYELIRKHLPM